MVERNQGQTEGCVDIPEEEPAIEFAGACITYAGWNSIVHFKTMNCSSGQKGLVTSASENIDRWSSPAFRLDMTIPSEDLGNHLPIYVPYAN